LSGSLDTILTWTNWLAIPGHNPHIERGMTNLRYDFIAKHGTAYNFQIYIYGSNGWKGDGNTGWLVSPSVLKIDTVKPSISSLSYTAGNRNTDLNITYL